MTTINNKHVLITGAASGLGLTGVVLALVPGWDAPTLRQGIVALLIAGWCGVEPLVE